MGIIQRKDDVKNIFTDARLKQVFFRNAADPKSPILIFSQSSNIVLSSTCLKIRGKL